MKSGCVFIFSFCYSEILTDVHWVKRRLLTSRNHSVVSLGKGDDKLGVGDEELALVTIRVTIIRSVYQASDDKYDKIKSTHI